MDAFDIAEKIKKYWMILFPKNSGQITKSKDKIKVVVLTTDGYREVVGVKIEGENLIKLVLDEE
jgi:hypothetical protein